MGNTEMPMDEVVLEATQFVARCYGCASSESMSATYPELVSRGVSKSRKFKWLVKVGACKDVNPLI